jgi:hypothetical protein
MEYKVVGKQYLQLKLHLTKVKPFLPRVAVCSGRQKVSK